MSEDTAGELGCALVGFPLLNISVILWAGCVFNNWTVVEWVFTGEFLYMYLACFLYGAGKLKARFTREHPPKPPS